MLKAVTTTLILLMMLIFLFVWWNSIEEKQYTWVWCLIEGVYIISLFAIWG